LPVTVRVQHFHLRAGEDEAPGGEQPPTPPTLDTSPEQLLVNEDPGEILASLQAPRQLEMV